MATASGRSGRPAAASRLERPASGRCGEDGGRVAPVSTGRLGWQRIAAAAAWAVQDVHREEGVVGVEGGWEGRRALMEAAWGGEVGNGPGNDVGALPTPLCAPCLRLRR